MDRHDRPRRHEAPTWWRDQRAHRKALADPGEKALRRSRRHRLADLAGRGRAYRDKEEERLLPIMKAAGIKPE